MSIELRLDGVSVSYGATVALHPLDLTVPAGSFYCLLGPSGCGKSTTLGAIAGFVPVTTGRIILGGRDVTREPPQLRQIGVVFQNFALFPHMSAEDNIAYGLKIRGMSKADIARRVSDLVTLVRLQGKESRKPRQLSGGEQQRVAIARSLAIEPRVLLLDEPLSSLDARLREEMRVELKRIQRETGLTTVFVTHDQEEAFGISDRVAVMCNGRLEQVGTPRDIYQRPATSFVAQFIGTANRLRGNAGGGVLRAGAREFACAHAAGGAVATWYLRPEEITIGDPARVNAVRARVVEVTFSGALVTYTLDTDVGELISTVISTNTLVAAVGDVCSASWGADAGALLSDAGGGDG